MHALHSSRRAGAKREDGEAAFTAEEGRTKVGTPNLRALLNQRNATYRSRRSPVVMAA